MNASQKFKEKYGINASELIQGTLDASIDWGKSVTLNMKILNYAEKNNLKKIAEKLEANDENLTDFEKLLVEALAQEKFSLPKSDRIYFDPVPQFQIPILQTSQPKSKGVLEDFKDIVGDDELRPVMMGVYVDGERLIGTDAHALVIDGKNGLKFKSFNEKIIDLPKFLKSKGRVIAEIDGKYPNYDAVIPKDYTNFQEVDLIALNNYLFSISYIIKNIGYNGLFHMNFLLPIDNKNEVIGINYSVLKNALEFMLKKGYVRCKLLYSVPNRALLLKPLQDKDKDMALMMPIMLSGEVGNLSSYNYSKPISIKEINETFKGDENDSPKVRVSKAKDEPAIKKYDLSKLSGQDKKDAQELIDAIETFTFLLDGLFEGKYADGGILQMFSSPQIVDGIGSVTSVFADGGEVQFKAPKNQLKFKFDTGGNIADREKMIADLKAVSGFKDNMDKNGMKYFVLNELSSGMIANRLSGEKSTQYKYIDQIRQTMLDILEKNGDMPYSIENTNNLIYQAERMNVKKLALGNKSFAEASEDWNKKSGIPTKKEVAQLVKDNPELLMMI
jgi:hypothetical protein